MRYTSPTRYSPLFLLLAAPLAACAQPSDVYTPAAIRYDEAEGLGVDVALLDATHGPAVSTDPAQAVFPRREEAFVAAWTAYLGAFARHLRTGGFEWSEPIRGSYRFYFRPDGHVEVVTYRVPSLEGERAEAFGRLLDEFVRAERFGLTAEVPFAQCGPVTIRPLS